MTVPDPGQTSVNQVDYIQTLEEDLARETRARRLLTAMLAQKDRVIHAYVDRYGDITASGQAEQSAPDQPAPEQEVTGG